MDNEILRDKFRGMMLGLAVGDSLGAPFAGWERVDRKSFEGREHDPSRLSYTDDTHLSIGVAESLIDHAGFDGKRMGTMSARNYKEDPWRKYSQLPPQLFELLDSGVPWPKAAEHLAKGASVTVDGPANRVAPAASDLRRVAELTRQIASITDVPGWATEAAVLHALAVALLVGHPQEGPLDKERFMADLRQHASAPSAVRALGVSPPCCPPARHRFSPGLSLLERLRPTRELNDRQSQRINQTHVVCP